MHVYAITNRVNGKIYIGQHSGEDLEAYLRLQCRRAVSSGRGSDKPCLYRAIRKYGLDAFMIVSIVRPVDKGQMNELERFFVKTLDVRNPNIGYNLAEGGLGGATRTGYQNTASQKIGVATALRNRPKTEEHRKHLSEAKSGKPCPAVVESNIRRRSENPSMAALRSRAYRARQKEIHG